jgi:hypothetical protein
MCAIRFNGHGAACRRRRKAVTSFGQDIRPLFRDMDINEMSFAFDLGSYGDVREHASAIVERLEDGSMPCDEPWPAERIELFRQWVGEGCPE